MEYSNIRRIEHFTIEHFTDGEKQKLLIFHKTSTLELEFNNIEEENYLLKKLKCWIQNRKTDDFSFNNISFVFEEKYIKYTDNEIIGFWNTKSINLLLKNLYEAKFFREEWLTEKENHHILTKDKEFIKKFLWLMDNGFTIEKTAQTVKKQTNISSVIGYIDEYLIKNKKGGRHA
ncbi:hypothetical protein fh0823_27890 (plasmid) [Francisella halioticida]|uniref:hypothetical protein n=1 Tax=Francisella halioticida TaxID=549298 RepID=UPI001AF721D1|nr:hypothetical protein [Francisella halioticida]BCD92652.1 hypothetical protein fh0823_27890 [Francisella halioticida]